MKGVSMGTMLTSVLMSFTGKLIAALGVGFVSYTGILHWRWWSLFELDIWRNRIHSEY